MASDRRNDNENPYFAARKAAATYNDKLNSREGAAELLGLSPSTLAYYELGVTKNVPPDNVCLMADLYNAPELKGRYCLHECPIGKGLPLADKVKEIEQVAIQITRALKPETLERIKDDLLEVAEDGIISEEERPKLQSVMDSLEGLQRNINDLRLLAEKYAKG